MSSSVSDTSTAYRWEGLLIDSDLLLLLLVGLHERTRQELSNEKAFPKFGLTDTGILQAANGKYLVLTDDFRLTQYLQGRDIDVINFNHLRTFD